MPSRFKDNLPALLLKISLISVLCSCALGPKKFEEYQEGTWTIRTMIRDKVKKESVVVNLDTLAIRPNRMRMEFITPLGVHLGSFAMNEKKVQYALHKEKKFYQGKTTAKALQPLLKTELDPRWLLQILFEQKPGEGWVCQRDKDQYLESCSNEEAEIQVRWLKRKAEQRNIEIQTNRALIQMNLRSFQPKVEESESSFELQSPKGYRKIKI